MLMDIFRKYKEVILYVFFGGLTTLVNFVTYWILTSLFHIDYLVSNIVAWILSVLFAYITNKIYVFESKVKGFIPLLMETSYFFGCRLLSLGFDEAVMYIGVTICGVNDLIVKIISNVIVVILNYFFSKLIIFKKVV